MVTNFRISHSERLSILLVKCVLFENIVREKNTNFMEHRESTLLHKELLTMLEDLILILPHDNARCITTDGLDNPDRCNGDRATSALVALGCFQNACRMEENIATAAADLIGNLLHLVHSHEHDPVLILRNGLGHFLRETGLYMNHGGIK